MYAWDVLIVLLGFNLVALFVNAKFVFAICDPDDSKYVQGLLAKVVAVMGLQFVVNAVIVFPADCYANHAGNTILAELYWFLSHMSLLFYLIFLAPYALLFVDAESGNSKAQSGWRRSAWFKALFWTVVVCVLVLVAAGLLVLVLGRYYILDPADPSRMIMMQLGFKEYCITVVMWFGVFFVVVYCPVGFVVLPLHCILKYIDRPVSIAAQDYVNQKQALAEKAGALRSLGEGLRDRTKRVNNLKGVRGWWMQSRNRALIERYRASTCLLRSRAEQLEECFFYKPVSQIKAVCWLCLGIVCIVMSSLWTLHIVEVGILPGLLKKPPRIYLWDRMLIFGSQSNIFIIEFLIYLFFYSFVFIATTAGFHKTGMRTPYGIHMSPLRKEGTHVNQILIFTMTLCFTGTGLNMFVWILCPQWAAESVLHKLFANYKTNGFYEVVFNNYAPALWVTAGIELASIIYFSIRPRDRFMFPLETPEDVKRTEDMAASWRTANAPLTQQARGPRTGLRDLGQKIQDKEADVVNRAKGAVPMGMRAGMKMA
ncbi:MAG: uncharacterized protein KVP18_004371 [Porospora cf. gigantea A]|uniref:uncharacterized protein n=1 Tax=Porospora cf. gigantea A TaxID=2853593 RepID=UPI00355A12EE|nr:MAG: hypothetical protein KVP18_004371 [Porospora cf. gigantea A]